jgi:hypothetical protein
VADEETKVYALNLFDIADRGRAQARSDRMNGPRASGDVGGKSTADLARIQQPTPHVSRICWRTTVAHVPTEDRRCAAESACIEDQGGGCSAALPEYS